MYKRKVLLAVLFVLFILFATLFYMIDSVSDNKDDEKIEGTCQIAFDDDKIYLNDESMARVDGRRIIIGKSGNYQITGQSDDASIVIDTTDNDSINIVLENLSLACKDSSPFYVKDSGDIKILLIGYNSFEDSANYENQEDGKPDSCIYSKSDVTFMGDGHLNIHGVYGDGIFVKGDLEIDSGQFDIEANGDGIKVNSKKDSTKGRFIMGNGKMSINSLDEGIQADNEIKITGGEVLISSVGDYIKCDGNISVEKECVFTK